jgi:hypothetical protein
MAHEEAERKMASQGVDGQKTARLLKGWLRYAENLNGPEEEMVQVCEPETGRNLSERMGSAEDLKNCQEGREEIPVFQVGNELRSLRDLRTVRRTAKEFHIASWAMK